MIYKIKLLEMPNQPALAIRTVTPVEILPQFFGPAYSCIMQHLTTLGEYPAGMPYGLYFNMDMSALDVEAGFPVAKELPGNEEIKCVTIPGGKYISTIHRGAYDAVAPAYDALTAYAKENQLEPTGLAYEYYLNDPGSGPDVIAETEIRFPVK